MVFSKASSWSKNQSLDVSCPEGRGERNTREWHKRMSSIFSPYFVLLRGLYFLKIQSTAQDPSSFSNKILFLSPSDHVVYPEPWIFGPNDGRGIHPPSKMVSPETDIHKQQHIISYIILQRLHHFIASPCKPKRRDQNRVLSTSGSPDHNFCQQIPIVGINRQWSQTETEFLCQKSINAIMMQEKFSCPKRFSSLVLSSRIIFLLLRLIAVRNRPEKSSLQPC